ncbi:MAG: cell division protein FtsQ/DivIB [Hyphomicrobiaceae bacterium]
MEAGLPPLRLEVPRDALPTAAPPPAFRHAPAPAAKRKRRGGLKPLHAAIAAAVLGTGIFASLTDFGRNARDVERLLPPVEDLAQLVGLSIDQVAVVGQRYASERDILDALDLDRNRVLPLLDSEAARARIEALPWVEKAELTRVPPGQLDIRIKERKPFAVWRSEDGDRLIDRTGRVLQAVETGAVTHLPLIAGADAAPGAASLLALVSRHAPLANRFSAAERVAGRRWRIMLAGGSRIELPAEGDALALERLAASGDLERLLSGGPRVVDLRADTRIAVRELAQPKQRVGMAAPSQQNLDGGDP